MKKTTTGSECGPWQERDACEEAKALRLAFSMLVDSLAIDLAWQLDVATEALAVLPPERHDDVWRFIHQWNANVRALIALSESTGRSAALKK